MLAYFNSWRRQLGVVTLLTACIFMAGWLLTVRNPNRFDFVWREGNSKALRFGTRRSQIIIDSIDSQSSLFLNSGINQSVAVWKDRATGTLNYPDQADNEIHWTHRFVGFDFGSCSQQEPFEFDFKTWRFPYWSIVIPLAFLSTWLLLSKPRSTISFEQKSTK